MTESENVQKKLQDDLNMQTKRTNQNFQKKIVLDEKKVVNSTKRSKFGSSTKENRKEYYRRSRDIINDLVKIQSFNNDKYSHSNLYIYLFKLFFKYILNSCREKYEP